MARLRGRALVAAIMLASVTSPLPAAQESFRVRYDASLYGLPIGRAVLESRFEGRGFAIAGSFASAGIARIFDRTDGTVSVNGWMGESASQPKEYRLDYESGKKKKKTAIRFANGRVTETENRPEPKKRGKDWVPVAREHLADVADPLSALLLPVASAAEVCRRTVKVYDGETRADLVLQPATKGEAFSRAAVTCRARFVPVAGYRKDHSSIKYLRDRSRILVGFQPVEGRDLYSPIEATIATKVGTVHIRARPM
ncbi:DUF3108 domain-containing protein [Chelativorans salis]|uniref:DUF3108 domain-containing protein n=1 Tax=Chelativorans salis TaxID=2978478 RepID=A0ABT2LS59_9HYPH|nr:DUF3108 domain-containing protein [Chelativorans sp. EGI FJ00035]MCT7377361.1 DUF3108 domain-containing protein [Chelativorans sp. EGI FJ00035]